MKLKWPWTKEHVAEKVNDHFTPPPEEEKKVAQPEPVSKPIEPVRTVLAEVLPSHTTEMEEANQELKRVIAKTGVNMEKADEEFTDLVHRARRAAFRDLIKKGQAQ